MLVYTSEDEENKYTKWASVTKIKHFLCEWYFITQKQTRVTQHHRGGSHICEVLLHKQFHREKKSFFSISNQKIISDTTY